MAPTGLDVKQNIVRLAGLKGIRPTDFINSGISPTTVKSIFRLDGKATPDLETVNRFAEVLDVDTYLIYMKVSSEENQSREKLEFLHMVDATFEELSPEERKILLKFYEALVRM